MKAFAEPRKILYVRLGMRGLKIEYDKTTSSINYTH